MPTGFYLLIAAQFLSALADNALLIVTMAVLQAHDSPAWWAPLLKFGFTLAYVVLAPVMGDLADAFPKARLMAWMNGVKWLGACALMLSVHPVLAFCLVGLGAAGYAPAKYGLITELVPPRRLVAANGWIEVSVVTAALVGTGLGGWLVSTHWLDSGLAAQVQMGLQALSLDADALMASLLAVIMLYVMAGLLNLGVPDSGARYPASSIHPRALVLAFWRANRTLWRDPEGGLSLAVTTLFWGVAATLQFIVLRWAEERLSLSLSQAAYLQAAVAVGVVCGAMLAARFVPLAQARRVMLAGVVLGLMMPVAASVQSVPLAVVLLIWTGVLGGLMVVPLNALLQHRGHVLLTAGRSVAVQGFNENASILVMLSLYAGLLAAQVSIIDLMWGFGLLIAVVMCALMRAVKAPAA